MRLKNIIPKLKGVLNIGLSINELREESIANISNLHLELNKLREESNINIFKINSDINELREENISRHVENIEYIHNLNEHIKCLMNTKEEVKICSACNLELLEHKILECQNQNEILKEEMSALNEKVSKLVSAIENNSLNQSVYIDKYEYNILKKININIFLEKLISEGVINSYNTINILGHYSSAIGEELIGHQVCCYQPASIEKVILSDRQCRNVQLIYPYALKESMSKVDSIISLNVALSKIIIDNYEENPLTNRISDSLVMVVQNEDQDQDQDIVVTWGKGFSALEKSEVGIYYRWYTGEDNTAEIYLDNKSNFKLKTVISFYLDTLDAKSTIEVVINNEEKVISMDSLSQKIFVEVSLIPGINILKINYFGRYIQPNSNARKLKFCISDLNIKNREQTLSQGLYAHENLLSDKNPYNDISDEKIREVLHANGFFEIENYYYDEVTEQIISIDKSRYLEPSFSYYFVEKKDNVPLRNPRIYIARRKGRM